MIRPAVRSRWRVGLRPLVAALAGLLVACSVPGRPGSGSAESVPPPEPGPSRASRPPGSSATPSTSQSTSPSPSPALTDRCARLVAGLDLEQRVGQLFMAAVASTGATSADARALQRSAVGSVLLLGNTTAGVDAVREVTTAARRAAGTQRGVRPLLAADQEGGQVQRLRGDGFSRMPSAVEQAELSDAALSRLAKRWADQLVEAGIDVDLAPVADVVPTELREVNQPIGRLDRGYGSDPARVAQKVTAFVEGMDDAGVATAVKHFPGLGRVRGNTDFEADVIDRQTRRDDLGLAGFRAAVAADVDLVMVASASYRKIDREHRAAFSPAIMEMIRSDLGFGGVIISDDLAATAFDDVPADERALRFLRAGGDLAIVGDVDLVAGMASAVVAAAENDRDFAREVAAKATRVVALKARRGLADC